MNITPFIRPIKIQGGTFYSFSSAVEDFNGSFGVSGNDVSFSKFALLNLPKFGTPANGENFIQLNSIPGSYDYLGTSINEDLNTALAESFQNYCMNLEVGLITQDSYDIAAKRTVSERVFFKWLKEIGAIRFNEAGSELVNGSSYGSRFKEEDSTLYNAVVQYIGDIAVMNNVRTNLSSHTEAYIHVPSGHGSTPNVLFDTYSDGNYKPDLWITNNPDDPLDTEYVFGRKHTDNHPAGIDFHSYFDSDSSMADFWYFDADSGTYVPNSDPAFKWWYSISSPNTFYTEPTAFSSALTEKYAIGTADPNDPGYTNIVRFSRSTLDGISLEFDSEVYKEIQEEFPNGTFGDYNSSAKSDAFDFNAVLVYYDVVNKKISTDRQTNLFGVLFLDNVDPVATGGGEIPSLPKYKPNDLIKADGNSYAFKLNLKWNTGTSDTGYEISINDYSTFSLQLYIDALNALMDSSNILTKNTSIVNDLQERVNVIEDLVINDVDIANVMAELNSVRDLIEANSYVFLNNDNLVKIINRNYEEITNIYNGKTSIDMSYNLDVMKAGSGIELYHKDNTVKIINSKQAYNLVNDPRVSIENDFNDTVDPYSYMYTKSLYEYENMLRITDGEIATPFELDRNVAIYIDDSKITWSKGQKIRISFENGIDISTTNGNYEFRVFTDALNKKLDSVEYSVEMCNIPYYEFDRRNGKPIIEIVCVDPVNFDFIVDVL